MSLAGTFPWMAPEVSLSHGEKNNTLKKKAGISAYVPVARMSDHSIV